MHKKFYLIVFLVFASTNNLFGQCAVIAPVPNNACYQQVIAADTYCCNWGWDAICQGAYDNCMASSGPCPVAAPVPNDACYQQVIANDPWCCNNGWDALCQSAYDACNPAGAGPCASIANIIGCGTSQTSNMSGTGVWNVTACGYNTPGVESIWAFTPTTTGIHSINVTNASGGFIDMFWMNSATGCGPNGWNCIDDVFSAGNYGSMNWVAGQTYYILLDPEGTGAYSLTFSVDCPNPGTVGPSDCSGSVPICSNANFAVDPNGFGTVNELCTYCISNPGTNVDGINSGCLLAGELNSTWMQINVAQSGTLEFSFGAPGGGVCFDWAMWDYTPSTCANILNNTQAPTSCNWNGWCDGFTGITSTLPAGGYASNFQPTMNVNVGDQFVIMLSNYSSAYTNVPLNFFGTADISCTPLPVELVNFIGENKGDYNSLTWSTQAEIHNAYFNVERGTDGENFVKVGEVQGAGNTLEKTDYRFNDVEITENTYYYRLKQVDFDGIYKYSPTISVSQTSHNQFRIISIYPNPASDLLNLNVYLDQEAELALSLTQLNGTEVFSNTAKAQQGSNVLKVPVESLAKGIYLFKIRNTRTNGQEIRKITID